MAPTQAGISMSLSTHVPDCENVEQAAGKLMETSRTEIPQFQTAGWISIRGQATAGAWTPVSHTGLNSRVMF